MNAAAAAAAEDGPSGPLHVRARHIKKRSLKNKSLSVSFNEKDLKDYVTGFHKRKKKRRKEALQKQEASERRKRIEQRKKRKLERDFVIYGGAVPGSGEDEDVPDSGEDEDEDEDDEDSQLAASVSGTTMYDNGNVQVTVMTSEISQEEEYLNQRPEVARTQPFEAFEKSKHTIPINKKKQLKKVSKKRSRPKPQSKRDKKKGKKKNKKH